MGTPQRFYTISQKEIDSIVNIAAGAGADAGIAAYKKAEQKAKDNTVNRNLNNGKGCRSILKMIVYMKIA